MKLAEKEGRQDDVSEYLRNLSGAQRLSGALRASKASVCQALQISREQGNRRREAECLQTLGPSLAACGIAGDSMVALRRSLSIWEALDRPRGKGHVNSHLAQRALWLGDPAAARPLADRAWELAHVHRPERDFIRAARLQGAAALGQGTCRRRASACTTP